MAANAVSADGIRRPYSGSHRALVVAIDVGTTFSGVSYAILEPGEIPKIHGVTRFRGQEHVAGNSKIPSVIYYDKHGKMMAAGAEADTAAIVSQAEDEGWIKAELFKLRLRPRTMQLHMNGMRLSALPKRKTAVHVFGDFLAYLFRCTQIFITDTHANGAALWNAVEHNIQLVLSHPNGWEGPQQSKMRRAAIYGGLIPDTNEGKARIRFVTEGEASLHACVLNGLAKDVLSSSSKHGFLIADAGGGTLDISSYAIRGTLPLVMEEIAPPDCIFAGSVFVSRRAREFLGEKLKNSKYGTPDALDHITRRFDETTKRLFRDKKELQFIPFGSPLDKDLSAGIRSGQLKLTGNEVASLFEPSVEAAFKAIKAQIDASKGMIRSVFLVGGYAASPWLFGQLQERLKPYHVSVNRPDSQTSKAVADGAIGFYCDHHVSARMSKFMYGVEYLRELDPANPDHVARREKLCELPSGPRLLPDAFDCILSRGVKVKESTVFSRKYCTELTSLSMLSVFEVEVWCFRGGNEIPKWIERHSDAFSTLCIVQADLSVLSGSAEPKVGRNGKNYWTIVFSVEIHFGLTEFKARIKWVDNGNTKYGPATIIYNEHGHRSVDEDEPDAYPEDDHITSATPRSERLRSLPASRACTPTEPHFPSSPGGYMATGDSNGFGVEAANIRGVPPPAPSTARERTLSKPTTPGKQPTSPLQMEREPSMGGSEYGRDSRRTSMSNRGREAVASMKDSRANSMAGGRPDETPTSVWGSGSDSQSLAQSQMQTQPPTQSHIPKTKSRKSSMSTAAHISPQPPAPPPPEVIEQPGPSARGTTAPPSPRPPTLSASRGISRLASPALRSEKPLSPLNPSAQAPLEPEPTTANVDSGAAFTDSWGMADYVGSHDVPPDGAHATGFTIGDDTGGFGMSTGAEEDTWGWNMSGNDQFDNTQMDNTASGEVPGMFVSTDENKEAPPADNGLEGAATMISASLQSFLPMSNSMGGIGSALSSSLGFGFGATSTKKEDTETKTSGGGFGWGSASIASAAKANQGSKTPKASDNVEPLSGTSAVGWGSTNKTPKSSENVESRTGAGTSAWGSTKGDVTPKPASSTAPVRGSSLSKGTGWGSSILSSWGGVSKGGTPSAPTSKGPSNAATPHPPSSPKAPEQQNISTELPASSDGAITEATNPVADETVTEVVTGEVPPLTSEPTAPEMPVIANESATAPATAGDGEEDEWGGFSVKKTQKKKKGGRKNLEPEPVAPKETAPPEPPAEEAQTQPEVAAQEQETPADSGDTKTGEGMEPPPDEQAGNPGETTETKPEGQTEDTPSDAKANDNQGGEHNLQADLEDLLGPQDGQGEEEKETLTEQKKGGKGGGAAGAAKKKKKKK
ncbi:hypothetical protein AX17_006598 [Amanita inopinata Kibby_2008]|nr:hypothetical protein AX17_006598 [Amanita inopinata Kibby_2008]